MRQLFVLLCLLLVLSQSHAQEESPIIALHEGAIYAVNPEDGSAEILVPAPNAYEETREFSYDPVTVFSAEWLSPDGQYLAYRMLYPLEPSEPIDESTGFTQRLFILDLLNGGFPESISLVANEATFIQSVAWSLDGSLLYVLVNNTVKIIERDNWTNQATVELGDGNRSQAPVIGRQVFATENGFVVADTGEYELAIEFTVFDFEGNEQNFFKIDWSLSENINLYVNTPFTPLVVDGSVGYAFVDTYGQILYLADFATGEAVEFDSGYFTGMVSRTNPEDSLIITAGYYYGDGLALIIRDNENNYLGETENIRAYAFGILGDSMGSTFAFSPDGQSIAYLEDEGVRIWEDGESRSLDFSADVVVWASPLYVPVYDPDYFRG